jgi:hypothetical protein
MNSQMKIKAFNAVTHELCVPRKRIRTNHGEVGDHLPGNIREDNSRDDGISAMKDDRERFGKITST